MLYIVTTRFRYVNSLVIIVSFARGTRRVHSLTRRVGSRLRARVSRGLGESIRLGETLNPRVAHYLNHLITPFSPPSPCERSEETLILPWELISVFGAILWRCEEGEEERSKEKSCSAKIQGQIWVIWGIFGVPLLLYALNFH